MSNENNSNKIFNAYNRLSITYDIDTRNTLGVSLFTNLNKNRFNSTSVFEIPINTLSNKILSTTNTLQTQATANYKSVLNDKGTNLSVSGDYLFYRNDADNQYTVGTALDADKAQNTVDLWKMDANVKTPIGKATQLTAGGAVNIARTHFLPITLATSQWATPMIEANMRSVSPFAYVSVAGQKGMFRYNVGLNLQQNYLL